MMTQPPWQIRLACLDDAEANGRSGTDFVLVQVSPPEMFDAFSGMKWRLPAEVTWTCVVCGGEHRYQVEAPPLP